MTHGASPAARLGILGGGQLARMLAEAALRDRLCPVILAHSADEPAAIDGVDLVIGALDDESALSELIARSDCVTLENEFLDLERLRAALDRRPSVRLCPGLPAIAVAQDKLQQKRLFGRLGIATAEFEPVRVATIGADVERLERRFPDGFVLKWSRYGYDGRGNLIVGPGALPPPGELLRFCRSGEDAGATIYAERLVDFVSELALVSTRAGSGAQEFFPLVVSRQEQGICREVFGPAVEFGVDPRLEQEAVQVARAIGAALEMCGSFAVEFFLCRDGRLVANEMAPRVHNSGHYTLFADQPSQFDLHVQAVTRRPLSRPAVHRPAAMRNILGPLSSAYHRPCPPPGEPAPPGTSLYWYGKRAASPGRKMGHITGRAGSVAEVPAMLQAMREYEDRFWARLADERQ